MSVDFIQMAKLAEQAERYTEMVEYMDKAIDASTEPLDLEQRNLLSVAYKNVVGARRASLRIIGTIEKKEQDKPGSAYIGLIKSYKQKVNDELENICNSILDKLDNRLIKNTPASEAEPLVFYQKMKADYYRYLAEFADGPAKSEYADSADKAYGQAAETAAGLASTHPIRLGLALNQSVFLYEVKGETSQACILAKSAFDDAIAELDTLDEESYKDSTLIMQLLRDNLTLWSSSDEE